jgi:hypothetical protein
MSRTSGVLAAMKAGAITLGIGTYIVYWKATDNPETPGDIAGQLEIS